MCVFFYINIKKTRLGGGGYPDRWQQHSALAPSVVQYPRAFCAARLSSGGQCRSVDILSSCLPATTSLATISLASFSRTYWQRSSFFAGVTVTKQGSQSQPLQSSLTQDDGRRDKFFASVVAMPAGDLTTTGSFYITIYTLPCIIMLAYIILINKT